MSVRRLLLLAFSLVALPPAALMMLIAFWQTREVVRTEIEANLSAQAQTVAAKLQQSLFERVQNAVAWSDLEVMQEVAVGDIDKRLTTFLADSQRRYGTLYRALHVLGIDGRVVARSDPTRLTQPLPAAERCSDHRPRHLQFCLPADPDAAAPVASLTVPLRSRFDGSALGTLLLQLDWRSVQEVLDTAAETRRQITVMNLDGQRVAASAALRGAADAPSAADGWLTAAVTAAPVPGLAGEVWTTRVQQSLDTALAPIRRMALAFVGLLVLAGGFIVVASSWLSARIARPLVQLSEQALQMGADATSPRSRLTAAPREVLSLQEALERMLADLEAQRQTLVRAAKLAAVGEFAAIMAHEIRTPLGILRSSAQTIDDRSLDAPNRELVGFIISESQRMERLVNSLLDQARARPPQRQPQDFEQLVARSVAMVRPLARDKGIDIQWAPGARQAVIDIDGEQILQVLFNLLRNAIQILPAGGVIRLSSEDDDQGLRLRVHDDGPGIAEADLDAVFEPFIHRREGGIGIGLAVVREIIRAHGGDVRALPSARGACFELRLPRGTEDGYPADK